MIDSLLPRLARAALTLSLAAAAACACAQSEKEVTPKFNQKGKDVLWAPTPPALVEKMLDLAKVTSADYVVDLGSGDGRIVIAAAKRGARALGIEFNPDLVALSKRNAEKAGVAGKASFVQADIFASDFSQASVITIYLLPQLNERLRPKFLALRPGTRVVSNSFHMADWAADESGSVVSVTSFVAPALLRVKDYVPDSVLEYFAGYCAFYCTAHLWTVPAKVEGVWRLPQGELDLRQKFQRLEGTLESGDRRVPIANGRVRGDEISFEAGGAAFTCAAPAKPAPESPAYRSLRCRSHPR